MDQMSYDSGRWVEYAVCALAPHEQGSRHEHDKQATETGDPQTTAAWRGHRLHRIGRIDWIVSMCEVGFVETTAADDGVRLVLPNRIPRLSTINGFELCQ